MTTYERQRGGKIIEEVVWTPEELDVVEKPNGPAVAALWAAGIGSFLLGVLVVWAEASASFAERLRFQDRVGPLSGKTTIAGIVFVAAWVLMAPVLWRRNIPWTPALIIAGALIAGGAIGTFPKFFELFAPE
jgi:hypothetical protein